MSTDDHEPTTNGRRESGDAAEPFSPPARRSRFRRNWMMLAAIIVGVLAVSVYFVVLVVR